MTSSGGGEAVTGSSRGLGALIGSRGISLPDNDAVELWYLRADPPALAFEHLSGVSLSPEEGERAQRIRDPGTLARFVTGRLALRALLAAYLDRPPGEVVIVAGPQGKPELRRAPRGVPLEFNLAHSGDWVALAFSLGDPVGVDIEAARPPGDLVAVVDRVFSEGERKAFRSLGGRLQAEAFWRGWTRKEAVLKAEGSGFSRRASAVESGLDPEPASVELSGRSQQTKADSTWFVRTVDAPSGYRAAVARRGGGFEVRLRGLR